MKVKTIDISAKKWFDRINGNTYFSATVTVNYGTETKKTYQLPFQYGYGNHYRSQALKCVKAEFPHLAKLGEYEMQQSGITINDNCQKDCKKRDLFNPTQKDIRNARKRGKELYPYFEI